MGVGPGSSHREGSLTRGVACDSEENGGSKFSVLPSCTLLEGRGDRTKAGSGLHFQHKAAWQSASCLGQIFILR